jgi:hypothetical protein
MVVLSKKKFKLPFVDSHTYRELMRLGLQYNRQDRSYSAEDLNSANTDSVLELLSRILKDRVSFEQPEAPAKIRPVKQTCITCDKSFQCNECRYFELCETKDSASSCVCGRCLEEGKPLT